MFQNFNNFLGGTMKSVLKLFLLLLFPLASIEAGQFDKPVFIEEFIGQMKFVQNRLTQLAEAIPEDKYNWKPAEDVRSFGEVFIHTAEANIYFITLITGDKNDFSERTETADKKSSLDKLNKSYDYVEKKVGSLTEDDLNREIEAFGMKFTVRNFLVTFLNHGHEHLGQLIAYSRMNGITPPWSMTE